MPRTKEKLSFREILEGAAKPYRYLWNENGELNLNALAVHFRQKGHPVSQPNLWRLYRGKQAPGERVIEATHLVFGVAKARLRGESMAGVSEKLGDYHVSTLLLAERLEKLSKEQYYQVSELVELFERQREELQKAVEKGPNVTPFERKR